MNHPYDRVYLEKARNTLGRMLDYAVYSLHQNPEVFAVLFAASDAASLFECGDVRTVAGMSGVELAFRVMDLAGLPCERVRPRFTTGLSKEYITGCILAQVQWDMGFTFADILLEIRISEIIAMYEQFQQDHQRKLAEAWPPVITSGSPGEKLRRAEDAVRAISEKINEKMSSVHNETHLKTIRKRTGMSQSELASASGVPIRTIQQYEQRQKDIRKAGFEHIIRLAGALHCDPVSLLERPQNQDALQSSESDS